MNDVIVTYQFTRDVRSGFLKTTRPSTDAMALLWQWSTDLKTREFEVIDDTDDMLVATIKTTQADIDADQGGFAHRCTQHGVLKTVVNVP